MKISDYADDNYVIQSSKNKETLIANLTSQLELLSRWLSKSWLKVNEAKTDLCLFYKQDSQKVSIILNGTTITSKSTINVLGVLFDSKMQWSQHVSASINKANSALHAIRMIRKFFTSTELLQLITSNYYSILYYNSEIWHLKMLKPRLSQMLLSASAKALKITLKFYDINMSFDRIH